MDELLQQSPRELNEEPVREHKSNIKEINMTTQLLKREIYIVRYENNPLIDNWLQSFIWVSWADKLVCDFHSTL